MVSFKEKKDRLLTNIVITLSLLGIFYFGYQAISDSLNDKSENPFEYNIEYFKQSDTELHHYLQSDQISIKMNQPSAIAVGPNDRMYVADDTEILIIDQSSSIHTTINCGAPVRALFVDQSKNLYVAKSAHIEVYDDQGIQKAQWDNLGQKALITSITAAEKYVFVADAGNHIVWKYDKKGQLLGKIGQRNESKDIPGFIIPSPFFDVAVDPDGFLWVVNPGRHSLENYTLEGDLRSSWGQASMSMEGFCGCCNPSHISILKDGSFVTSEKGIVRVKVYNRLGNLVSVVAQPSQFIEGTEGLDLAVDSHDQIYVLDPKKKTIYIFKKKSPDEEELSL
jgi:DNA-binding beta-propeller fold protein YncE